MIYLDNASTTKMFEQCLDEHRRFSCEEYFNPSAMAAKSVEVSKNIAEVEKYLLLRLGAKEGNIIFTGCATESNNLAICGNLRNGDYEYVFSAGEHPSVDNVAKQLQQDGYKVHFVPLNSAGCVDLERLKEVLSAKTRLISIMHVSNETGAINDLQAISNLKKQICPKAILHVDGVQGFMKIPFALRSTEVDLYSFSGHKIHAPKGIAGLYVKNKAALKPLFQGGGQQFGVRSGTENVSGIMQLKKAVELIDERENFEKVRSLKQIFQNSFSKEAIEEGLRINDFQGSPYITNLVFGKVKGETMLHALEAEGVIVGLGSACSSKKAGNRVLENIGMKREDIISSARISFNAYLTESEVKTAAEIISRVYLDIKKRVS